MASIHLSKSQADLLSEILKRNPDFIDKESVVMYSVRRYYDELRKLGLV